MQLPEPGLKDDDATPPPNALALAVALALAQADETLAGPLAALEASSLPLERSVRVDAPALIEAWRALLGRVGMDGITGKARELAEENELLALQLRQVQEELETYFQSDRDLYRHTEQLQTENARRLEEELRAVYASLSWKLTAPLRALARPFMKQGTE
jgi:hypothetical protein